MIKTICANYGLLGHELETFYTADLPVTELFDVVQVEIPDKYKVYETVTGSTAIMFKDDCYSLNDVLATVNSKPYLSFRDRNGVLHRMALKIVD